METYLDNGATTYVYPEVAALVAHVMCEDFGNPSSMHKKGVEAEKYMKSAAKDIAQILKVEDKNIYFTSGGTESNNWALIGAANANKRAGMHIITTCIEHSAVSEPMAYLEKQGFEITKVGTDKYGVVNPQDVIDAMREDTILVSVMAINNEVGSIQPVDVLGAMIKKKNPKTLFHVDAIQAFCKMPLYPKRMKIDMLSVSGHKIHGPKGTGFLYVAPTVKILPLIYGGGQQNGYRSGTDNVPGAAGLSLAAKMMSEHFDENVSHMQQVRGKLIEELGKMENVAVNGQTYPDGAPHIVNASFIGIRSEVLLHSLEDMGIYVSSGSACSSHKRAASATLSAMGCDDDQIESSIRFSFCETTSLEEIERTVEALNKLLPMLRKYTRH